MKKLFVLDTNILISDPRAIYGFEDNDVVITHTTLQELDKKKSAPGELGFNAREAIREIENLRTSSGNTDLTEAIIYENGGSFRVVADSVEYLKKMFGDSYETDKPDNRIIGTVLMLTDTLPTDVILVTNDVAMRLLASCAHINKVESYKNDHVSEEEISYPGITIVKDFDPAYLDALENSIGGFSLKDIDEEGMFGHKLCENEYVSFEKEDYWMGTSIAINQNGFLRHIPDELISDIFGVTAKNTAQKAALCALSAQAKDIPLVILKGPAGCAKTFLSLAAGLDAVFDKKYDKVMITRSNVLSDNEFGFLPGDLSDKMGPLLAPFYDNLTNLYKNKEPKEDIEVINAEINDLFDSGVLDICAMAYMRGRSIANAYLIVDEAQNCSRSQIRDIITRAGIGTKIIICGDPSQIDAKNLDSLNNGLVFASHRFKNNPLCAQITFDSEQCVRSELAKSAIDVLKL